jgi:hypothetical protein
VFDLYAELADLAGANLPDMLNGQSLDLPGLPRARKHFQAAREIDPRWWMKRMPTLPVPGEYRALMSEVLEKSLAPLKAEFARTRH